MTPARERILRRLREASREPGHERPPALSSVAGWGPPGASPIETFAERFRHFLTVGDETYGSFRTARSIEEAAQSAAEVLRSAGAGSLVAHPSALCVEVLDLLPENGFSPARADLVAAAEAALCEAALLCVATGSYLIRPGAGWARAGSLLPPVQVVLGRESALVGSLGEALQAVSGWNASCCAVISGPSRTADVEKTLVVPAHGPRELHLILALGR